MTGPLAYAVRQGYISDNPWKKEKLEYQQLFKSKRRKKSEDAVFYPDEIEELVGEFERGYEVNRNTANLGLEMNFELGLRIGELAALKWKDINWINRTVFVQREEDSSGAVEEYVKSDSPAGYRELALTDAAVSILKRLKSDTRVMGEYIFVHADGTRKTAMQFAGRLEKAEIALGWEKQKRSHCIRRTVASRMNANHIPLETIRAWLGHTDTQTTLKYIFNPFRVDDTHDQIRAVSILSTNSEYSLRKKELKIAVGSEKIQQQSGF